GGAVAVAALRPLFPDTPGLAALVLVVLVVFASGWLGRRAARATTATAATALVVVAVTSYPPVQAGLHAVLGVGALVLLHTLVTGTRDRQTRLVAALRGQVSVDVVTGLLSRAAFDPAARTAVEQARVTGDDVALVLVDVDDFKGVNDVHGHPAGDAALLHLARVLRAGVRQDDALVARLGGDELAVLLPGCPRSAATSRAHALVERVRAQPLVLPDGSALELRISAGVAVAPEHGWDLDDLYAAADVALYVAKRTGRDRVAVADAAPG
ncbi:GGDEF domain-containing protein, partial [Klenkia sp. PcliD-1-E]|uniref:GGDEF domain-containing protein n=1 Tax=Klenkia sp. PcliD-1-E TaxID=2954492 RepID=UPI0020986664